MARKLTINVRSNLSAPYGIKKNAKEIATILHDFFKCRGSINHSNDGKNYIISSYIFQNGINAEIKIRLTYSRDGNISAFNILAVFDCYKLRITEALTQYRTIILGFVDYLNKIQYGWYIDVFVFRIYPLDFIRHFHSKIGDIVTNIHLILTFGADFCIINSDRLEFRCDTWSDESIDAIMTVVKTYTRK